MDYLQAQGRENPEQAEIFSELSNLSDNKLWHQLTGKLQSMVGSPFFKQPPRLVKLYEGFVKTHADKINQLQLAQFGVAASRQIDDAKQALEFLESLDKTVSEDPQGKALTLVETALRRIKSEGVKEAKGEKVKELLDATLNEMNAFPGVMSTSVHSAYYLALLRYHKAKGNSTEFFDNAIKYLQYTPLKEIDEKEQVPFAFDVALSALIGPNIYNFGELLKQDIVDVLKGTSTGWVANALSAFNTGDIKAFSTIFAAQKGSNTTLQENESFLMQKVRVMRLMEVVFRRPSNNRSLTFSEISKECQVPLEQVEWLLMKAFSLKVVKGVIDQVSQTANISWVQARVLDKEQLSDMSKRLKDWSKNVAESAVHLEENSPELLGG